MKVKRLSSMNPNPNPVELLEILVLARKNFLLGVFDRLDLFFDPLEADKKIPGFFRA